MSKKKRGGERLIRKRKSKQRLVIPLMTVIIAVIVFFIAQDPINGKRNTAKKVEESQTLTTLETDNEKWFFLSRGIILENAQVNGTQKRLVVYAIIDHSKAQKLGIAPGDYLVQMNGNSVNEVDDVYRYIKEEETNQVVFSRNGEYYEVVL